MRLGPKHQNKHYYGAEGWTTLNVNRAVVMLFFIVKHGVCKGDI